MTRLLPLLLLGCVEAGGGVLTPLPGSDARAVPICAAEAGCVTQDLPDAQVAPDATADDAGGDARPADAGPGDTALPDAAPPDAPTPDVCAPIAEVCDGEDDDCDGAVDEDFDLQRDLAHCGGCGRLCARTHGETACAEGECTLVGCEAGWLNADLDPANGCEAPDVRIRVSTPAEGDYLRDVLTLRFELVGAEHVDHVRARLGELDLGLVVSPIELDIRARPEGPVALSLEAVADDTVLGTSTVLLVIDRTPPVIDFAAPEAGAVLRDAFEVRLTIDDGAPVEVRLDVDDVEAARLDAPFTETLRPTDYEPGAHGLRAIATDAAGNVAETEREVRFSFCREDATAALGATRFEVDLYEASRPDATIDDAGVDDSRACSVPGVLPWGSVDYAGAVAACEATGKRLCTIGEWLRACGGQRHSPFPYGLAYQPAHCNGADHPADNALMPTGTNADCVTDEGAFDLSGNLAEWTLDPEEFAVSGGHTGSPSGALRCNSRTGFLPAFVLPENGFRCCRDL